MDYETEVLKENVDGHIKEIKRRLSELEDLPAIAKENADNIQHNYELIYELKDEIEELKQLLKHPLIIKKLKELV